MAQENLDKSEFLRRTRRKKYFIIDGTFNNHSKYPETFTRDVAYYIDEMEKYSTMSIIDLINNKVINYNLSSEYQVFLKKYDMFNGLASSFFQNFYNVGLPNDILSRSHKRVIFKIRLIDDNRAEVELIGYWRTNTDDGMGDKEKYKCLKNKEKKYVFDENSNYGDNAYLVNLMQNVEKIQGVNLYKESGYTDLLSGEVNCDLILLSGGKKNKKKIILQSIYNL